MQDPAHDDSLERCFGRSHAIVIGIDAYQVEGGASQLHSAVDDARAVARALSLDHGFDADVLIDPSLAALRALIAGLAQRIASDDRLIVYFAGHGVWREDDGGPGGALLPRDARLRDPSTFYPMRELSDALSALPCRHLLVVLDCCFAGAFRWTSTRNIVAPDLVSRQRFTRYVESAAWQVIASAAPDQEALDGTGKRGETPGGHSPFAAALLDGLAGAADVNGDGLITTTELYLYVRARVEDLTEQRGHIQSPGLFPLRKHERGEFVFRAPGRTLQLPPAEALTLDKNPYRGLESFDEGHHAFYFGRARAAFELAKAFVARPLTVVVGASGTGKSSLVKAGLVPMIRRRAGAARRGKPAWHVIGPYRPREAIEHGLLTAPRPDGMAVVVIDQLEEVLTQSSGQAELRQLLEVLAAWLSEAPDRVRVVTTVRSDFEPLLEDGPLAPWWRQSRYAVPPMSLDELRAAIERPAEVRDLHFEPTHLVDQIANEVLQMPGALPLLSFTLRELYRVYCQRGDNDRALRAADYRMLGGVARAVTLRADEELAALTASDPHYDRTIRNVMLRATEQVGGESARRRVPSDELIYEDPAENLRVENAVRRYVDARLLVDGAIQDGGSGGQPDSARRYVEPAHDVLIRGWPRMLRWLDDAAPHRALVRAVAGAVRTWLQHRDPRYLWHADPRLAQLAALARDPGHALNADEVEFVRRSVQRRRHRRLILATIATAFVTAIAVSAVVAFIQRDQAIAAREAETRSRHRAETLVDHMAYDLPEQLAAVGHPTAMRDTARQIDDYYRSVEHEDPTLDLEQLRRRVAGRNALANVWLAQGQLDLAHDGFAGSLALGEDLARRSPGDERLQRDLYVARMGLSGVSASRVRIAQALDEVRRARQTIEALLTGRPDDPRWRLDRAQALIRESQPISRSDTAAARTAIDDAIATLEPLAIDPAKDREAMLALSKAVRLRATVMDPDKDGGQLARDGMRLEALLRALGDGFDARVLDERSRHRIDNAETRGLPLLRDVFARIGISQDRELLDKLGALYQTLLGEVQMACLDRHVLTRLAPSNVDGQRMRVRCRLVVAQLRMASGDGRRTADALGEAWQALQEAELAFPEDAELRREGAIALDLAAMNARQHGEFGEARRLFALSLERARKQVASDDPAARTDLAQSLLNLASVEADLGNFPAIPALLDEALAVCTAATPGCDQVRALAAATPGAAGPVPLTMRFRVTGVSNLAGMVERGAMCAAYLRPMPAALGAGCHAAVVSCSGWRVLGSDHTMGRLQVTGARGAAAASCDAASRLELATGILHISTSSLLGTYTIDARIAR